MAEKLSSPHDNCFRTLMQQPENALAFFRCYLAPEWQQPLRAMESEARARSPQ